MATIALIGPDGAGKTAIARRLEARQPLPLKYLYMGVNAGAGNVSLPTSRLLHRLRARTHAPGPPASPGEPRSDAPRARTPRRRGGLLWSAARLVHHLAEEWYRQLACWWFEASGRLVVCDRHLVLDYAPEITPKVGGFDRSVRRWVLTHLYPAPDLVVFLDAPGHVLFARKGEATIQELERRRRAYLRMGERLPGFVRVDATLPLEEVYEQVAAHVLGFHGTVGTSRSPLRTLARSGRAWAAGALSWVRERWGPLHARLVCKSLDAVLTAELRVPGRAGAGLASIFHRSVSRYERLRAVARATHAIPGTAHLARRSLLRSARLPFDATAKPLSFGSGSTVFRLDEDGRSAPRVLKVYRRSLGQHGEELRRLARHFREKYAAVLRWYGEDLVVPTQFTILHSPLRGYAAVACVQPYIPDAGDDFLARSDEEVLALLRAHTRLRHQFQKFAACTLRAFERERRCLDLLGHGNLSLTGGGSGSGVGASHEPRLSVFDFGIFDLVPDAATPTASARRLIRLVRRIEMLNGVAGPVRETEWLSPCTRSSTGTGASDDLRLA